jgi:tetratricopeptide (TPR) repeat protein
MSMAGTAIRADKDDVFHVSERGRWYPEATNYLNCGVALMHKGDTRGARGCFDAAIRIDKNIWPAYLDRAEISLAAGQLDSALQDCNTASRLRPDFYRTFTLRAQIYRRMGRCEDALNDLNRVLSFHSYPEVNAIALNERALLRATCKGGVRSPKLAIADAQEACNLDWHKANYLATLGIAYAVNGDFDSAIKYEQRAIQSGRYTAHELQAAKQRLARYQQHQRS